MFADPTFQRLRRLVSECNSLLQGLDAAELPPPDVPRELLDALQSWLEHSEGVVTAATADPDRVGLQWNDTPSLPELLAHVEALENEIVKLEHALEVAREDLAARDATLATTRHLYGRMHARLEHAEADLSLLATGQPSPQVSLPPGPKPSELILAVLTTEGAQTRKQLVAHGELAGHTPGSMDSALARLRRAGQVVGNADNGRGPYQLA